MTLNLSAPHVESELKPRIVVVGVGGAGCNAVNNMITSNLEGVEFVVANTDAQSLALSHAERRIQLGTQITHGLGAGARPDIGRAAAEEVLDNIVDHLQGSHMAFITAGMGGGTGTGAAPVIARAAREHGILTVGVVTKPFQFEGAHRMSSAEEGIEELQHFVDTLIVIPNQNLFRVCNEKTTFADAFRMADNVLYSGVRGVTDLMVMPGLINLDFADIRTVMSEMGKAMMGTGEANGERRAIDAAEAAIANPLLDDVSMRGAHGVLINITGGPDMTLFEVDEAANRIREEVDSNANIIFGSTFDEALEGLMRVSIVATGIEAEGQSVLPRPGMISLVHDADRPRILGAETADAGADSIPAMPAMPAVATADAADIPARAPTMPPLNLTPAAPETPASAGFSGSKQGGTGLGGIGLGGFGGGASSAAAAIDTLSNHLETQAPAMDKPFITPPPVMPEAPATRSERRSVAPPPAPLTPPSTTTPVAAGDAEPEKRRGFSLFQRVTGAVTPRRAEAEPSLSAGAVQAAGPVAEPVLQSPLARPAAPTMPPLTAAVRPQQPPAGTAEQQPLALSEPAPAVPETVAPEATPTGGDPMVDDRLGDDRSAEDRLADDEDLLEIPAFLRRQANH